MREVRSQSVVVGLLCIVASGCAGNLLLGQRQLSNSQFWEPLENQTSFGIFADHVVGAKSNVGLEWGLTSSIDSVTLIPGVELQATTVEMLSAGVRVYSVPPNGPAKTLPYFGVGATYVGASLELTGGGPREQDESLGFYAHAGVLWKAGSSGVVGFDIRYIGGTSIDLPSFVETDADGLNLALVIGWGY